MSRIGKKPVEVPQAVKIELVGQKLKVIGPKGELKVTIHQDIKTEVKDGKVFVVPARREFSSASPLHKASAEQGKASADREVSKKTKAMWGLYRALIANMVEGVEKGFEKKLEIEGVGFKAAVQGDELVLNLGFVNPVKIKKPEGITFLVEKNVITVSGVDKQAVGQISAEIRETKKAEPYKGKGIKYQGEKIRRKEGKKVVAAKK